MEKTYNGIPYTKCQYETLPIEERESCCGLCKEMFGDIDCEFDATKASFITPIIDKE